MCEKGVIRAVTESHTGLFVIFPVEEITHNSSPPLFFTTDDYVVIILGDYRKHFLCHIIHSRENRTDPIHDGMLFVLHEVEVFYKS